MKIPLISIALTIAAVVQGLANNEPKSSTLTASPIEKSLILDVMASTTKSLSIIDSRGKLIFQDQIEENKQRIKYDVVSLRENTYTINVKGENNIDQYKMIVKKNGLSIEKSGFYYRPTVRVSERKIMINGLSSTSENIKLTIFNEKNDVVFKYKENSSNNYSQVFNLTQLEEGNYNVIVSTDHFSEIISVSL